MQKNNNQGKGEEEGCNEFAHLYCSNGNRMSNLLLPEEKAFSAQYHKTDEQSIWNGCFQRI